jgi:hypothetical protein
MIINTQIRSSEPNSRDLRKRRRRRKRTTPIVVGRLRSIR